MSSLVTVLSVLTAVFVLSTCFLIHCLVAVNDEFVNYYGRRLKKCEQAFVHCSFVVFVAVLISWPVLATLYDSALVSFVFFVVFAIIFLPLVVYLVVGYICTTSWSFSTIADICFFLFLLFVSFGFALSLGIVAFAWGHEMDQTSANASVGNITGTSSASGYVGNVSTQTFLSAPWFEPIFWGLVTVVTAVIVIPICYIMGASKCAGRCYGRCFRCVATCCTRTRRACNRMRYACVRARRSCLGLCMDMPPEKECSICTDTQPFLNFVHMRCCSQDLCKGCVDNIINTKATQASEILAMYLSRSEANTTHQCPKCACGPIEHFACANLTHSSHNRCPSCNFSSKTIREWPKWNGELCASLQAYERGGPIDCPFCRKRCAWSLM